MLRARIGIALLAAFLFAVPVSNVDAQAVQDLQVSLVNDAIIVEYGELFLNETFTVTNPTAAARSFPGLALNLPLEFDGRIVDVVVSGPVEFSKDVLKEGNFVKVRITPKANYQIAQATNATVRIGIATTLGAEAIREAQYKAFTLILPTSDIVLSKVRSNLIIARGLTFFNATKGFNRTEVNNFEALSSIMQNVAPSDLKTGYIFFDPRPDIGQFTFVDFSEVSRTIVVQGNGQVKIRDVFRMSNNKGLNDIFSLRIRPAVTDLNNITVVSLEQPPLKSPFLLQLVNARIDLQRGYGQIVRRNEQLLFQYEYPLKPLSVDGGVMTVSLPAAPPVGSIITNYRIKLDLPQNYKLVEGERVRVFQVVSSINNSTLQFRFRPGVAWSSNDVFPIATGLFVVMFISLLSYSMRAKTDMTEVEETLKELMGVYEEKVSLIGAEIAELKGQDIDKLQRKQLDNIRNSIGVLRSKAAQRAADARRILLQKMPEMQKSINELVNIDSGYDRIVQQYLQTYDQHLAKRISREVFRSTLSKLRKDLNTKTNDLVAMLTKITTREQ